MMLFEIEREGELRERESPPARPPEVVGEPPTMVMVVAVGQLV